MDPFIVRYCTSSDEKTALDLKNKLEIGDLTETNWLIDNIYA